jgi:hypothetical protein
MILKKCISFGTELIGRVKLHDSRFYKWCYSASNCSAVWCESTGYHLPLKGKAIPLQAWTGPEGSRRLRIPDFKTMST